MTSLTPTMPPAETPPRPLPTWQELVNEERRLLDELVQFERAKSRRPPREVDEIVADALEKALAKIIDEERDEERLDLDRLAEQTGLSVGTLINPRYETLRSSSELGWLAELRS